MEIHILRDGKQIGPFSEEATQSLLKQGKVMINDLAWQPGAADWLPLYAVLYPAATGSTTATPTPPPVSAPKPPPPPVALAKTPAPATFPEPVVAAPVAPASSTGESKTDSSPIGEPASPRQKALLTYMSVAFPTDLTKAQAALLVNEAMENPRNSRKLQGWNTDRLRLHPDIFADEIKAKRENRAQYFFEICQAEGGEFFEKVTKAHTQVLVGYLDVRFPNWDEREDDAKFSYFFPAIAEKFPQLLKKNARGKFKYPEGPKVSRELTSRSSVAGIPQPSPSAAGAMFRGAFMGLIILAMLYYGWATFMAPGAKTGVKDVTSGATPAPASASVKAATPVVKEVPKIAAAPTPVKTATPPPAEKPPKQDPPADDKPKPEIADATPPRPENLAGNSAAVMLVSNPFEPLAPTAPIPVPVAPPPPAPPPLTPSGRTSIKLIKPTVVVLKFGTSTLQAGTVLPIVAVEGATVKARYATDVVPIPVANTDLNDDAPPAAP